MPKTDKSVSPAAPLMTIPPADTSAASDAKPSLLPPPPPLDGFAPQEFKARRDALRAGCPDGILLVRGSTEDEVPAWAPLRYRQNSNFFYLTGVDTPGAFLVLLPDGITASSGLRGVPAGVREVMFIPNRDASAEAWSGPKLGPGEETEKATGIARAMDAGKLWAALTSWLRRNPVLYTVSPYGETAAGTREYALMRRLADLAPVVQFRDVSPAVAKLRVVKSPAEVDRMRQAATVSAEGQRAARAAIARGPGKREYDVEAEVFRAFRGRGATLAFASIVGGGVNATTLHYEDNSAELKNGDLVVVDVGARVGHYCGDLTRTYPVGGKFGPRQREVYDLVLAAHRHAVSSYRPGEDTLDTLNDRSKEFLKNSPMRSKDAAGAEKTMDVFMPHNIGHFLGLDVHDVGDREPMLAPGHVITIEPGVYLPPEAVGVRIEDDYLVTPTGLERLGEPLEVDADEIEGSM